MSKPRDRVPFRGYRDDGEALSVWLALPEGAIAAVRLNLAELMHGAVIIDHCAHSAELESALNLNADTLH